MIDRYTRKEMGDIWDLEHKFQTMMQVEIAVAEVEAELGMIPKAAAQAIKKKAQFSVERIAEIEKTTKHDVIAFVSNLAENVGPHGRYIHYGLTSSDVIDTALSLQIRDAYSVLKKSMQRYEKALNRQSKKYADTLCSGRTHGMHAEPTTFGLKLAGFLAEFQRNKARLDRAVEGILIGKLSGAVGTYSALGMNVEKKVCKKLKLKPETIATQVIPRDRHAELMNAIALMGAGLERVSVELRHLQRTEVYEVTEGFSRGQKGSSAMPHKKNPISSENLTGAARLLRSYAQAAMENVALWHERDISHSSVERVVFPDAFILCDYALDRMAGVIENIVVDKDRMLKNMDLSQGQLFSSHVLLLLVKKGLSREEAYKMVQRLSHALQPGDHLRDQLYADKEVRDLLSKSEIDEVFSGKAHKQQIKKLIQNVTAGGQT
ncbi:MAG: adenylosuccinate lyase [Pseudobdellovibrionaceae bacterium]|nr:adenylosuccinate lyase [Bdellovibrionales bacterium]USN48346.1 MAG: adenylosuccinate lyase [Pseudobdellovibrionaceae bacterium]